MGGTGYKGKFCTNPIQFIRLPMQNNFLGALRKPRTRIRSRSAFGARPRIKRRKAAQELVLACARASGPRDTPTTSCPRSHPTQFNPSKSNTKWSSSSTPWAAAARTSTRTAKLLASWTGMKTCSRCCRTAARKCSGWRAQRPATWTAGKRTSEQPWSSRAWSGRSPRGARSAASSGGARSRSRTWPRPSRACGPRGTHRRASSPTTSCRSCGARRTAGAPSTTTGRPCRRCSRSTCATAARAIRLS